MSLWQITKNDVPVVTGGASVLFDDGVWALPGEDGFTQDPVRARVASLGAGYGFNYVGRSPTAEPAPANE